MKIKIIFFISLLEIFLITSCGEKKSENHEQNLSSNQNKKNTTDQSIKIDSTQGGPSNSVIETELYYLVSTLPYDDYRYNTCFFLDRDGVYKNLVITNWDIVSRQPLAKTEKGDEDLQYISIHINGFADYYKVIGFNQTSYVGKINYSITKDFAFTNSKNKWMGQIYDKARDRRTLKFVKKYIRF